MPTEVVVDRCPPLATEAQTIPVLGMARDCARLTAQVAVHGSHAYTSTWRSREGVPGNVVTVWDVSGNAPRLVDSLHIDGVTIARDVQVSDDGGLLGVATEGGGGSLALYSLANPSKPVLVSRYQSDHTKRAVYAAELARTGGTLYAFLSADIPGSRLAVLDLSDPASPREVLIRPIGGPLIHDTFVRDSLLFTALQADGVSIWDIGGSRGGTPANPVLVSTARLATDSLNPVVYAEHPWWFHDPTTGSRRWLFLSAQGHSSDEVSTSSGAIHVVDLGDLANPRHVAIYSLNGPNVGAHHLTVDEESGVLYVAYREAGVRALDVRGDLSSCTAAQRTAAGLCDLRRVGRELGFALASPQRVAWGVTHLGNRVYVSDMVNGLWTLDITALKR